MSVRACDSEKDVVHQIKKIRLIFCVRENDSRFEPESHFWVLDSRSGSKSIQPIVSTTT